MKPRSIIIFLVPLIFGVGALPTRAASDDDTVYARNLPGGRRLLVLKAELPKHEEKKDEQGRPVPEPGIQYPEHSYEYTFVVQSADGKTRLTVGKKWTGTMPGEIERMRFSVLDAHVYDDQLVVLCRIGRATSGDTALVGAAGKGFLMHSAAPLVLDYVESGSWAIGGRLEGSPKAGDLRAIVTEDVLGQTIDRRFLLVNQDGHYRWVPEPDNASKK